jgi:hypothetical protein
MSRLLLRRRAWTGGGSVSGLLPTRRRRRPRRQAPPGSAALSPGSDRWCLRAHTGRRPPACPNGTDARGQSHHPSCMSVDSVLHQRSWAKSPPCCMSIRHRHPWAQILHSAQNNWLDVFTSKSRAHDSISAAARCRPDSYNTTNSQHNFMRRAPSTAVGGSLWHGADVDSSLTACKLQKAMNFCCAPGPRPVRSIFLCAKRQMGRLERNAKPRAHGITPGAAAGLPGRPKILQPHLSGRGPGTAESGPPKPKMGMQAARRVV